jgi:RNA polymerase sigma factor (TIGR02999 family)
MATANRLENASFYQVCRRSERSWQPNCRSFIMVHMSDVTRLIQAIGEGDSRATAELLPIVYDELRRLARARMANERAGHTLEATALVHEAYLRLVGDGDAHWSGRGHFSAAAAEAMRRILVENARRKATVKRGGELQRVELDSACAASLPPSLDLLALDDALSKLAKMDPAKADLVKLRFFAGLTMPETAEALGISLATAERYWTFARTWLYAELSESSSGVEE